MEMHNYKTKNHTLKKFIVLLLAGIIAFSGLPMQVAAQDPGTKAYDTNFDWNNSEEDLNEWPLDPSLTKTNAGIGTAGLSYQNFYYDGEGRIVLEFELSIFPKGSSTATTFRNQWQFAHIFIDPNLIGMVDEKASFFKMYYPANPATVSLNQVKPSGTHNNIYKFAIEDVYPIIPSGSDYMRSKFYLVLKSGFSRNDLKEDYAVELRYTNNQGQIYNQTGSNGLDVLGNYRGYTSSIPNYDASTNNDDVTLKTIAPFQTASMTNALPNPYLPPDMMRIVGQSVIYDNINGKLHVYYKQAPNHYIYKYGNYSYADNGNFLSSWLGIRQVMDSRIYNALKPDANGVVGQMRMMDLNGIPGDNWSVSTDIRLNEFSFIPIRASVGTYQPANENLGTYAYMMVPTQFKTDIIEDKATVPANHTNNVKNVYLHGHMKEADYVRFIYNVDKNKMDELFTKAGTSPTVTNSSTLSISTSYITDRPTENNLNQTEYRLTAANDIVVQKGDMLIFNLPENSRSIFKSGLANNYERLIGNLRTWRPSTIMNPGIDPKDFGAGYTVTPYAATSGGFVLTPDTGLTIPKGDTIRLIVFDEASPATVKMTVARGMHGEEVLGEYDLLKQTDTVNAKNLYNLANANVRSGIIINRSANTPHVNEFFTDCKKITGHSKYPAALVSARKAIDEEVFKEALSIETAENFKAEGKLLTGGHRFALDLPANLGLKKDMEIKFSNAAAGYFRSLPATYRTQAKVTFDMNGGADGTETVEERTVPINKKAYGEEGYTPNGFNPNGPILKLNADGSAWTGTGTWHYSDYEGNPITKAVERTKRTFYDRTPTRPGYTFLGWSTKKTDFMSSAAFDALPELSAVEKWGDGNNYKFTQDSPVDESQTVYAVWERDIYQYNIVLHANNGTGNTHTMELTVASVLGGLTELTAYQNKPGNILFDAGFGPGTTAPNRYFVGWSPIANVSGTTLVHNLYTNASKIQIDNGSFQLQLNEEPQNVYPTGHSNPWQPVASEYITNDDGIATIHLYAQYKPLIRMTATKEWYAIGQKAIYEQWVADPNSQEPEADIDPHFENSDVAMVLMRTTEGKSLDPTKYEIVKGFYAQGTKNETPPWQWALQEGHDPNGRKYSYLMTEFHAQAGKHDEDAIIAHFNNKKTWASMFITMIGESDNLSKWTTITLAYEDENHETETRSYLAVATSNQPTAATQTVNTTENYSFLLRNFEVEVEPPNIHRVQENHTKIEIDSPMGTSAKYLYVKLTDNDSPKLFRRGDGDVWTSDDQSLKIETVTVNNIKYLVISSNTLTPLSFTAGNRVYATFTSNYDENNPVPPADSVYASREVKPYSSLDLEDVKQEPHIKDASGNITHNVISAKIPAGSYAGANYQLGYLNGDNFVAVTEIVTPDALEKLTFTVDTGTLNEATQYIIRGVDPADIFKQTDFNVPKLDLTSPTFAGNNFGITTGDLIGDNVGKVKVTDKNSVTLSYEITKDGEDATLPEGITFDPFDSTADSTTWKFVGKTADVLEAGQLGTYTITVTAEDVFGNVSTQVVSLTITQKPKTAPITSITQTYNDDEGNAVITIQGTKGAAIKFYSKDDDGTFTEVDIADVSGSKLDNDGRITLSLPKARAFRFNGKKVYVTQQADGELESDKTDTTGETIYRAGNKNFWNGGAIIIDNEPPVPIQMVVPQAGTTILKFANITANHSLPDVKDIDRIDLKIGDNALCDLTRQYDNQGNSTGKWTCSQGYTFEETEEYVTVIVNPNTGETAKRKVGVLTFVLPNEGVFEEYQVIKAKYYDYLGNISVEVTTSVPPIPRPVAPYDLTAVNDSQAHPKTTIITGKADPGAGVSVKVGKMLYAMIADEHGDFTLVIPKQAPGTELTLTSTLNGFTATATVTVTNVQADDYKPTIDPVEIPFGEAPTEEDIKNAISIPDNYPEEWEKPVITVDVSTLPDGKTPGDYEVVVEVAYPDESKDVIKVPVRALRKVVPRDAAIDSQIPKNYVRVYFDPTDDGWLQYNPTFDPDTTIAFDVWKGLTWMEAVANGMIVPTATHVDSAYTFDKWIWHQTLSGTTVLNNETHRYYYMVASYKPVEEKPTTPTTDPVPPAPTDPKPSDPTDSVVITGESPAGLILATVFILLGIALVITKRKIKHVK
ncbi:MAG: Rib/alpha-like domain-containing protein [Saccharofermentanales bacterium]|jgi:Rib/alpha/Esp surface antigen-like repeat protein